MKWSRRPTIQIRFFQVYLFSLFIFCGGVTALAQQNNQGDEASTTQSIDEFIYDPVGRRDPFKPWRPFAIKKAVDPKAQVNPGVATVVEITDPLLKHEIEQYSVLAIMWDVARPRALIKDPEGKSHLVFQGTRLGRNGGSIRSLREGEIVITESVDVNGEMKNTNKILEVKKGDFTSKIQAPVSASAPILKSGNIAPEVKSTSSSLPTYFDSVEDANAALKIPGTPQQNSRPKGNQNRSQSNTGQPKQSEAPR